MLCKKYKCNIVKNKYNLELCSVIFNFFNKFIPFIRAGKNMFKDRNITILEYGIITLMYTVLEHAFTGGEVIIKSVQ